MVATHTPPGMQGSVPKGFRAGTDRMIAPEQTVARVSRFLRAMGITRVANVTGLDRIGIPVVMVCRPNSRSLAVSQGKGGDLAAAKASGLMESVESYHAERIPLPLVLASYEELRYTRRVVDPAGLPRLEGSLYHPDLRLLWIEGHDLLQDEPVWVPYEIVHTNYTTPAPAGEGCFVATSSGLASGNHLLEAISHAICEVVERDGTSLWRLMSDEEQRRLRIDLDTVDDPACREVLERYERAGVAVAVWESTTDVGIPTFECLIVDRDLDPLRLLYSASGSGCHPVRQIALLRALTEAAQSRLTYIAGSRDDCPREKYERLRNPEMIRYNQRLMAITSPGRAFADAPTWDAELFDEDVRWELERLRAVGIERVIVINLTRPEFDLPVARVVIPGLEGTDRTPGYRPGPRATARLGGER